MGRVIRISVAEYMAIKSGTEQMPNSELYLVDNSADFSVKLIRFSTRKALESFNKKAGLSPLVYTQVNKGCKVYAHEKEVA